MKLTLPILSVVILGTTAGLLLLRPAGSQPPQDTRIGQPLVTAEQLKAADRIEINATEGEPVVLQLLPESGWVIAGQPSLPVDFPKLARMVDSLQQAKVVRLVTAQPERIARLDLGRSSLRIAAGSQTLLDVTFGRSDDSGGQFFRFGDEPQSYLLDQQLWLDANAAGWPMRTLLNWAADSIMELVCTWHGDTTQSASIRRPLPGEPFSIIQGEELRNADNDRAMRLLRTLGNLRFTEWLPANDASVPTDWQAKRTFATTDPDGHPHQIELIQLAGTGTFARLTQVPPTSPWAHIADAVVFKVADFVWSQLPESPADLLAPDVSQ